MGKTRQARVIVQALAAGWIQKVIRATLGGVLANTAPATTHWPAPTAPSVPGR